LPDNDEAALVTELLDTDALALDGPHGEVHVASIPSRPLWLYAGGTGISQALAMISFIAQRPHDTPVRLIWSVADAADFYCERELREFEQVPWFNMTAVVDAPGDAVNAAVRVIERDGLPPEDSTIVLCGGPGFVSSVADALASRGVARERMRSDMFTYASKRGV
jgi:NAD(P)H-flavin reductase